MALITKKDLGIGTPVEGAYIRFPRTAWLTDPYQWHIWIETWFSKECRILNVVQRWLGGLCNISRHPIPYSAKIAKKYEIPKENWDEVFSIGPWENPEEIIELLSSEIQNTYTRPMQTYNVFFNEDELEIDLPKDKSTMGCLYGEVKKCELPLFSMISSPNVSRSEVFSRMKDDLDGPDKMVEEGVKKWKILEAAYEEAEKLDVGYYDLVTKSEVGDESWFGEKVTNVVDKDKLFNFNQ